MSRRTKIVATAGPACDPPEVLDAALRAGIDVVRVNFSHGAPDEHLARVARFRDAAKRVGKFVAIMADLPGPKLRVKIGAARELTVGGEVWFSMSREPAHDGDLVITEPEMLFDVRPGQRMLLDDGRLQLEAGKPSSGRLQARVVVGGTLSPNKGLNLPDTVLSLPALTQRDYESIAVAAKAGVDWVAVSFVRGAEAAHEVRGACRAAGLDVPVLAKVERPEAVGRVGAIVAAFDAIMVARGDLGVELPAEEVPILQKRIVALCRQRGRPVVVATQMLESMISAPVPTRAEVSDVATAVFEGADAIMLSAESAAGQYPVEAVAMMNRIAEEVEADPTYRAVIQGQRAEPEATGADAIALAARDIAETLDLSAIVCWTSSGSTALRVARERPKPITIALTPKIATGRRLALLWGVHCVVTQDARDLDDMVSRACRFAFKDGFAKPGQRIIVVAGVPLGTPGATNMLRIAFVGSDEVDV